MQCYNSTTKSYSTKVKLPIPQTKCTKNYILVLKIAPSKRAKCAGKDQIWCVSPKCGTSLLFLVNTIFMVLTKNESLKGKPPQVILI